jgi:hypothetical protein
VTVRPQPGDLLVIDGRASPPTGTTWQPWSTPATPGVPAAPGVVGGRRRLWLSGGIAVALVLVLG